MEPLIAFFWLLVGVIAVTAIVFRHLREKSRNVLLQTLIEKGQTIPPDLFHQTPRAWDPRGFMVAGILLIGLGVATMLVGLTIAGGFLETASTEPEDVSRNLVLVLSLFPFSLGAASMVAGRYLRLHG